MVPRALHLVRTACPLLVALLVVLVLQGCQPSNRGPALDPTVDREGVTGLVDEAAGLLLGNYLDAGMAEQCAQRIRERDAGGAYGRARTREELAKLLTEDLQSVSHDLHMRVQAVAEPFASTADESAAEGTAPAHPLLEKLEEYHFEKEGNFGVMGVKWYSGNVGCLDLRAFLALPRVRPKIEGAMVFLADMDAVIIDLRNLVRGGYEETVAFIAGYFFHDPTLLQSIVFPRTGNVSETWTQAKAKGPDLSDVPLFILTSENVFSAGEAFTYGLQAHGRATVVGTVTRGGAHLTRSFRVEPGFDIYVPVGRAVNPVTGSNWEGTGVIPDVATDPDDAFDVALDMARGAAEARRMEREAKDQSSALEVEALLFEAMGQYSQGQSDEAAETLRCALHLGLMADVITEDVINDLGYYCLEQGLVDAAVEALRFNVERFPDSWNAYDSLGEVLMAAGHHGEAETSYRKALELNPKLSSAKAALLRLQSGQ